MPVNSSPSLRIYGRTTNELGVKTWVEVATDVNGFNDYVYAVNLCQVLQLILGESPFWANYGIPAVVSQRTQIPPDYYSARVQAQFSGYFGALTITRLPSTPSNNKGPAPSPTYQVYVLTHQGVQILRTVPT